MAAAQKREVHAFLRNRKRAGVMFVTLSVFLAIVASAVFCYPRLWQRSDRPERGMRAFSRAKAGASRLAWPSLILLAGLPLAPLPARLKAAARIVSAALLECFVVLGLLSVGILYSPSAAFLIIAAVRSRGD